MKTWLTWWAGTVCPGEYYHQQWPDLLLWKPIGKKQYIIIIKNGSSQTLNTNNSQPHINLKYLFLYHTSQVRANPARLGIRSSNDATRINCCWLCLICSTAWFLDCNTKLWSWSSFSISEIHIRSGVKSWYKMIYSTWTGIFDCKIPIFHAILHEFFKTIKKKEINQIKTIKATFGYVPTKRPTFGCLSKFYYNRVARASHL